MSFQRAARAALASPSGVRGILAAVPRVIIPALILALALLSLSCGSSTVNRIGPNHSAYVTLPKNGSVALLNIDGATGTMTMVAQTPQTVGTTPIALALIPSKKFLYAINALGNSISIFNVNSSDGTLTLSATPTPAGNGADAAVIDPTGSYLLVTNTFTNDVSVFSINATTGALTLTGTPVLANTGPSEILFTHSGKFVYVSNPIIGMVTGFSFSNGVLTPVPNSPVLSGAGAFGLAVDGSDSFLYVANPSANNPPPYTTTVGNISGFSIDPNSGALTPVLGSPFVATNGTGPTVIAVDPTSKFVYATTAGSSFSIWCFTINPTNGQLSAATSSPFSVAAGNLFALFDPSGNYLYIGNQTANGIEGYTYNGSTGAVTAISGSPFSTGVAPGKMVLSE